MTSADTVEPDSVYALAQRAATGDMTAFEELFRRHNRRVYALCLRMAGNPTEAEDLAQEALVAVLEAWPQTGIPDNPGAWLMTTAKRRGIDQFRRKQLGVRILA